MNKIDEFKEVIKSLGLKWQDISKITGYSNGSLRAMFSLGSKFPRWANLVIYAFKNAGKGKHKGRIVEINHIDTDTQEGKLLIAALARITTELEKDKTPFEVIDQLYLISNQMEYGK